MLQSNLSTRPFYNVHAVRLLLAVLLGILLVLTALHLLWARDLSTRKVALTARATQAKAEASQLRNEAQRMRAQINPKELERLSAAAREVNEAIDQRAFSWSSLLVLLEQSLPADVRVTSIQPTYKREHVVVSLHLESRSDEALSSFMDALERQGMFTDPGAAPIETTTSLGGRSAK